LAAAGGFMATFESSSEGADLYFIVAILGGFRLLWGTGVVDVPRVSQRLFAFLALHGGVVTRATVAGTLWPDASERQAYSNLRSALARLPSKAREALVVTRLQVALTQGVRVDIPYVQALAHRLLDPTETLKRSELGMATITALSSDLLPDWYDEWVLVEAEDWRQLRLHALEALTGRLVAAGRWGEAACAARAAVRAEPLRESSHNALIQVYLAEGNPSEAVRQFTCYRALLHAELGLEPTSRLRQLVQALRSPSS
jgi:SARP family transcriptional regulator, regulator of embCAB operon